MPGSVEATGLTKVIAPDPPTYSAVRAMLVKLESSQAVSALPKQENWTDDELEALRAEIEQVQEEPESK